MAPDVMDLPTPRTPLGPAAWFRELPVIVWTLQRPSFPRRGFSVPLVHAEPLVPLWTESAEVRGPVPPTALGGRDQGRFKTCQDARSETRGPRRSAEAHANGPTALCPQESEAGGGRAQNCVVSPRSWSQAHLDLAV